MTVSQDQRISTRLRAGRKARWVTGSIAAAVIAASAGVGIAAAASSPAHHKEAPLETLAHSTATVSPRLPVAAGPNLCGPWSAASAVGMRKLVAAHGVLQVCMKVGSAWVLIADSPSHVTEVGTVQCGTNTNCLDGANPHDLNGFTWSDGPTGRHLGLLQVRGNDLLFANMQGGESFNILTSTWAPLSPRKTP